MGRISADSSVFHAVADPMRRAILDLLRDKAAATEDQRTVMTMLDRMRGSFKRLSQSGFSQHLAVLRRAGLVTVRTKGRLRIYALRAAPLEELADWVTTYDRFWSQRLQDLHRYLDSHASAPTPKSHARRSTGSTPGSKPGDTR